VGLHRAIAAKISSKTLKEKTERQGLLGECHTLDLPMIAWIIATKRELKTLPVKEYSLMAAAVIVATS
jgi:hypothetical protein